MIKGIIFDLDGTLIDSMYIWDEIGLKYLASKGYNPDSELKNKLKSLTVLETVKYFKEEFNLPESIEEIYKELGLVLAKYYLEVFDLKSGVKDFLNYLKQKQIKLIIATATEKALVMGLLKRLKLEDYFIAVLTCNELNTSKNEPLIYFEALKVLNLKQEEVLVFEDAYHALMTAKKANFKVVGIKDDFENQGALVKKEANLYLEDYYFNYDLILNL